MPLLPCLTSFSMRNGVLIVAEASAGRKGNRPKFGRITAMSPASEGGSVAFIEIFNFYSCWFYLILLSHVTSQMTRIGASTSP